MLQSKRRALWAFSVQLMSGGKHCAVSIFQMKELRHALIKQ